MMSERKTLLKRLELQEFPQPDILQPKYPILLCHGFGAVGSLIKPSPLHDPAMLMREHGVIAFAPNIVPYASIEVRGLNWIRIIETLVSKYKIQKFNVVAHSMGGLDMRYALANSDIGKHVASLTTVATPHHGTYLANLVLKTPELITEKVSEVMDWFANNVYPKEKSDTFSSVEQLTMEYVRDVFNPAIRTPEDIPVFSYSASVGKGTDYALNPIFKIQNAQIYEHEGANDSFVSVESAKWGEYLGNVHISHLNQINVQVGKEFRQIYLDLWLGIIKTLTERGF